MTAVDKYGEVKCVVVLPTLIHWSRTNCGYQRFCCSIDPIKFLEISDILIECDHAISNICYSDQVDVIAVWAATYHTAGGTIHTDTTGRFASDGDK